ncbi:MAG: CoA-binding protein [Chloroflexota bacterium]
MSLTLEAFRPRGIAIVGASSDPASLGHRPFGYLARTGYTGQIYPVNPNRDSIAGWRCYPDLASVPDPVDHAMISVAAARVPAALADCAARGIALATLLSSGVAADVTPPDGLRVIGPNSMGFFNAHDGVAATWNSALDLDRIPAGPVALIAQSGGLGGAVLNRLVDRGVGVGYTFWSGEERFVDTTEYLEMLLDEPRISVVVLLIEGIRNAGRFLELARAYQRRGKPLVAYKLARAAQSREAALAHSGILTGERRVQQAAFQQFGIIEAADVDELCDHAALLSMSREPMGDHLAAVTTSGGAGILISDVAEGLGLRLPTLDGRVQETLRAILPSYATIANPLDVTAGLPEDTVMAALRTLARDPGVDVVLKVNTMIGGAARLSARAEALIENTPSLGKPLLSVWLGGSLSDGGREILRQAGVPHFISVEGCLRAVSAAAAWHRRRTTALQN